MQFKTIAVEEKDQIKIIKITQNRIFLDVTEKFRDEILQVLQERIDKLVLDFSDVHVMNSSGLGVLLTIRDRLGKYGGDFAIVGLRPIMQDVFERMKLDEFFKVYENHDQALQHFK